MEEKDKYGCGAADGLLKLVPVPHAKFFNCACVQHDKDYDAGGNIIDKLKADCRFLKNMYSLIREYFGKNRKKDKMWFHVVATINFLAVLFVGWFCFNWKKK